MSVFHENLNYLHCYRRLELQLIVLFDFFFARKYEWSKVQFSEKNDLQPYKIFLRNLERSFQTWEDGNNWPASKTLFSSFLLDDLSKNRNQFVKYWIFPLNFTRRVTWSVRSTRYTSKILLCGKCSSTVSYVLRNITNKLLLPVKLFDLGLKWFKIYPEKSDFPKKF